MLGQMHAKSFLSDAQYAAAMDEPLHLAPETELSRASSRPRWSRSRSAPCATARRSGRRAAGTRSRPPSTLASRRRRGRRSATTSTRTTSATALVGPLRSPSLAELDRHGRVVKPALEGAAALRGDAVVRRTQGARGGRDGRRRRAGDVRRAGRDGARDGEARGLRPLRPAEAPGERVRSDGGARAGESARAGAGAGPYRVARSGRRPTRSRDRLRPSRGCRCGSSSGPEGALVAIDARSRQVLALVGSYEGATGGLDRATQSRRQPGSTFKPIVYSYAIHARRFTPSTLIDVTPGRVRGGLPPERTTRGGRRPTPCGCARRSRTR